MKLGYNTNGLAHHEPIQGLEMLADIGYESVAITIDHFFLAPNSDARKHQITEVEEVLVQHGLDSVIETGARFLLDPRQKHSPTLLDPDPSQAQKRIDYLKYCIDTAAQLKSDCVSIWSGAKPEQIDDQQALDTLGHNLEIVLRHAEAAEVDIGFEPEPGMFVDSTAGFQRLLSWLDSPRLKMTLDIGHLFCMGEVPIVDYIQRWSDRVVNVHIEDMVAGIHDHLMFGDGHMHFPPIIESLMDVDYSKGVHVELSRHSHNAAEIAKQSFEFLSGVIRELETNRTK